MNTKQYQFITMIIGCNDKDQHMQILSDQDILKTITNELSKNEILGATISQCFGLWCGELEKSFKVEIVNTFTDNQQLKAIINNVYHNLIKKLNQQEITVNYQTIESNL